MTAYYDHSGVTIHHGDAATVLATLPEKSVQCCVTSPPYWGLRDYGTATWEGGDEGCDHEQPRSQPRNERPLGNFHGGTDEGNASREPDRRDTCHKCGARRIDSQLGLEATPDEYIASMVKVFRAVWRVLRDDGTLWVQMGDKHVDKQLMGMPWRLAFALQADGWTLRQDIIWHKPGPMPSSAMDRCCGAHEFMFLLSKKSRYYFDLEAIKEPAVYAGKGRGGSTKRYEQNAAGMDNKQYDTRHPRSVWTINTVAFPGAHFATFPPKLVQPCIRAGTSLKGCCPECGTPWNRVVEKSGGTTGKSWNDGDAAKRLGQGHRADDDCARKGWMDGTYVVKTLGWEPGCKCVYDRAIETGENIHEQGTIPCTVLDPFAGACTTLMVAKDEGCHAIGIELNSEYIDMAINRLRQGVLAL